MPVCRYQNECVTSIIERTLPVFLGPRKSKFVVLNISESSTNPFLFDKSVPEYRYAAAHIATITGGTNQVSQIARSDFLRHSKGICVLLGVIVSVEKFLMQPTDSGQGGISLRLSCAAVRPRPSPLSHDLGASKIRKSAKRSAV
jgi:hypothetical protein